MNIEETQVRECARQIKEYCKSRACPDCIFRIYGFCMFKDMNEGVIPEHWDLSSWNGKLQK